MHSLGTIREFRTKRFRVVVDAVEEEGISLDDLHSDPEAQQQLAHNLNDGTWILFCARARVFVDDREVASDYLGGCVYASLEDFADHRQCGRQNREYAAREVRQHRKRGSLGRCGSYFSDMVSTVCAEARKALCETPRVRC